MVRDPKSNEVTVITHNPATPPPNQAPGCTSSTIPTSSSGTPPWIGSCRDPNQGEAVTASIVAQGAKGVVSILENGTYQPQIHYTPTRAGTDQFKVQARHCKVPTR